MNFELNALFSMSIGIAAVTGWVRFRKTDPAFLPFLCLVTAAVLNEIASILIVKAGYSNAFLYNLFSVTEALIIFWQFKRWGLFDRKSKLYLFVQVFIPVLWLTELFIRGDAGAFNSFFIVGYSAIIVLASIHMVNRVMFREPGPLYLHPVFLICAGFILYFTYAILVEIFWFYGLNKSKAFRIGIYEILAYINLITNLIYAFATLWIPLKRTYMLPS